MIIITKTPVRISFVGGGSDIIRHDMKIPGMVFSSTINKYIYVIVKKRFGSEFRISYSRTELVKKIKDIKNPIIRSVLEYKKIKDSEPLEIITLADIPSSGSGLGSSSSLAVGLLKAISEYKNEKISNYKLAKQAYFIERVLMKKYLGYQDQFNAAFGGIRSYKFYKNHKITYKTILNKKEEYKNFKDHLLIFYTGINRVADKILKKMTNAPSKFIDEVSKLSEIFISNLKQKNYKICGEIMSTSWKYKKKFSTNVSNQFIDKIYNDGMEAGAYGGKILGAGGGGYFIFICPPNKRKIIKKKLKYLTPVEFDFEKNGCHLIMKEEN